VRDSTGVITARLIAEKNNPRADVIWGLSVFSLMQMDALGMLEPYTPKGAEELRARPGDCPGCARSDR
jgi:iron(III) transport system substrate-binding protein